MRSATSIRYAAAALAVLALMAAATFGAPMAVEAAGPGTTSAVTVTRSDGSLTATWPAVTGAAT